MGGGIADIANCLHGGLTSMTVWRFHCEDEDYNVCSK